jgi:hypothetical protein
MNRGGDIMKRHKLLTIVTVFGVLLMMVSVPVRQAYAAQAPYVAPRVFQAAGPTADSILGAVEEFRDALGIDNGSAIGPIGGGRREINWDGGGVDTTTGPETPFETFLNLRGARFTTKGAGLSQATPLGLATLFNDANYAIIFSTFSPLRLFTPVGSNITEALFFVPGTAGATPATVIGFGAVFTDVDQPGGKGPGRGANLQASTLLEFFDADNKRLFTSFVPASPGDGSLSFFGVLFDEASIAKVRITTGTAAPGRDDDERDIVMMDDFIFGEPQPLP